jgi:hypothetical protein
VVSLEFRPRERTAELDIGSITIYRLDFSAKIETAEGHKIVLIEIQKAKFPADIMRFRKYLGEQYKSKENTRKAKVNRKHKGKLVEVEEDKAIPILSIYFLGYSLEHFKAPVIRVQRECYDDATDEKLEGQEEFIECLTHDSYVIQVPYLSDELKTEVEKMLGIFDQSKLSPDHHILNIAEADYPAKYRPIIRRLQRAVAEPEVRQKMEIEDEITDELKKMARTIQQQQDDLSESEKTLEEKDKALEEKDKELERNRAAMEEKDKELAEKEKLIRELLEKQR